MDAFPVYDASGLPVNDGPQVDHFVTPVDPLLQGLRHQAECTIKDDPEWLHAPTICGLRRTYCYHSPSHTYGQRCSNYAEVGRAEPRD